MLTTCRSRQTKNGSTLLTTSGSALVFSLLVLSMILVAALGVASVSVIEQKNSSATGKSAQAFQVADSAIEMVLKKAVLDPSKDLNSLASDFTGGQCSNGVVSGTISGGSVELTFKDASTTPVYLVCGDNLSKAADVKAVGKSGDGSTTRAISSAVAAGTLDWKTPSINSPWRSRSTADSSFQPVQYAKDSRTGIVYLRGLVDSAAAQMNCISSNNGCLLFTISETTGFRPPKQVSFPSWNNNTGYTQGRVDIESDGEVRGFSLATGTAFFSLDGIAFSTN